MKPIRDCTPAQLENLMRSALIRSEWGASEISGYIAAQQKSGWLRQNCPQWIRNSAAIYYAHTKIERGPVANRSQA